MSCHPRPAPVTLKQLRALLAVARTNSFTLAAEQLSITQSAMSGLIRELESTLDVRLVDRSPRRVALSRAGRSVQPILARIVDELDRVLSELVDIERRQTGPVRIAVPQLLASTLLPEFVAFHARQHPEVSIRIVDCAAEGVLPRVIAGEVELGIAPERDGGSLLSASTLFELPFAAVLPFDHPLAQRAEIRWSDLFRYPFITVRGQLAERPATELKADQAPAIEVAYMSTALGMVRNGLGVTACIPYAVPPLPERLVMRPLCEPEIKRRYCLFSHRGAKHPPAAAIVANALVDFCSSRWPGEPLGTAMDCHTTA